jgi:hypothetical protein
MSEDSRPHDLFFNSDAARDDRVGLCRSCRHADVITSSKGSTFYLCTLSATDPRFRRYPVLPVISCIGYQPCP